MVSKQELQQWLDTLSDDAKIYADEDGLTLCAIENGESYYVPYLEIGGKP